MTLRPSDLALLAAVASPIANGTSPSGLNLFPLHGSFSRDIKEIVAVLAEDLEKWSNGRLTVRRADSALFANHVQGVNLYLVVCPADTPVGLVEELQDDMELLSLGPYRNGLDYPAKRASQEDIARSRTHKAEAERNRILAARRNEYVQQGKRQVEDLIERLVPAIRSKALVCDDPIKREDAAYLVRATIPSFDEVAGAAVALGISLEQVIADVLRQSDPEA